jgi:hypothetical protein
MARITFRGFDGIDEQFKKLMNPNQRRRIVEAGARKDVEEWHKYISRAGHVRTGNMMKSVHPSQYYGDVDGGVMKVYPWHEDSKGVPNALKAFVINYGRKGRKRKTRSGEERYIEERFRGDKFITKNLPATEAAVQAAMQEESDRILDEINR